jgi:alpha-N-arabinofuranosidase
MANIAQTVNVLQSMILTDDEGGLILTPTYHVFEMNKNHHGATHVPAMVLDGPTVDVGSTKVPLLSLSASTLGETALVSLTNGAIDEDLDLRIDVRGMGATVKRARVLTGESPAAHNTGANPNAVAPVPLDVELIDGVLAVRLPAHSFATIELELGAASF